MPASARAPTPRVAPKARPSSGVNLVEAGQTEEYPDSSDYLSVQPDYDEEDGDSFLVHNGGRATSAGTASQHSTPGYAPAGELSTPVPDGRQWRRYPQAQPGRAPTICDFCRGRDHVFRNCPTLSFIPEPIRSRILSVREWNLEAKAQPGIALSQPTDARAPVSVPAGTQYPQGLVSRQPGQAYIPSGVRSAETQAASPRTPRSQTVAAHIQTIDEGRPPTATRDEDSGAGNVQGTP